MKCIGVKVRYYALECTEVKVKVLKIKYSTILKYSHKVISSFMLLLVMMFTFTFMHLADTFIQSDLHCIQVTVLHFISSCFPWESNP